VSDRLDPLRAWSRAHPLQLVGPPGVGKSWLARRWVDTLDQEVVWTSLDGVSTYAELLHCLAVQLGLDDDEAALRALASHRPTVWVLDDAEAAGDAVAAVARALPDEVALLATTRRRLPLPGAVIDVPPLGGDAAAALFITSARAARHDFDPDAQREVIDAICAELSGLPLAIELAAARVRALTPAQIAERLSLDHLTNRHVHGRHRSLRQALASAVDGVGPEATRMLATASRFRGPFTLEALEAVGAGSVDELEELVDAGLVARGGGRALRLLGPVRAFAAELPAVEGADEAVAGWVVEQAEATGAHGDESFWATWRGQLDHVAASGGVLAARAAVALGLREALHGPVGRQTTRCEPLLADPSLPEPLRAALLRTVAEEAMVRNDYRRARQALDEAEGLAAPGSVRGALWLARAQLASDQRRADQVPDAALDAARQAFGDDAAGQAEVELVRSIAHRRLGAIDDAVRSAREALALVAGRGPPHVEAQCLAFLADAERHAGVAASERLRRLDRAEALAEPPKVRALVATKRAIALADAGKLRAAIASIDAPAQRLEAAGDRLMAVGFRLLQVACAVAAGEPDEAGRRLEAIPDALPHYAGVLRQLRRAQVAHARGRADDADAGYAEVLATEGDGYADLRAQAAAGRAALGGGRVDGLLGGVLERASAGPELVAWVEATGRWEARLLARLVRPRVKVARDGRWFQVGTTTTDLGRKTTQIRVLAGLAERAGRPVPVDEVLAFGWPGEKPRGHSGRARVHVTISSLRKAGLQGALWTAPGDELAYVLDAEVVDGATDTR